MYDQFFHGVNASRRPQKQPTQKKPTPKQQVMKLVRQYRKEEELKNKLIKNNDLNK